MSSLPTKVIYCTRSGLPLASVTALCSNGWPLLSAVQSSLLHPIYSMGLDRLLIKLRKELDIAEAASWLTDHNNIAEIRLCMSAIMYELDAIWQPPEEAVHLWHKLEPSLPAGPVAVASASRLLALARWYHYATSKRMAFPLYRISKINDNLEWQNYSAWLDDAFAIREEWESGRATLEREEQLRLRTEAVATIKSEAVYKRIDFNKVWNWIEIQMAVDKRYPAGRRETFKTIFMKGDTSPEDWTLDDIEDVQLAILETCDMGNEISYFINTRLSGIRAVIKDFYSSFTLLSSAAGGLPADMTASEQAATSAFFSEFDKRAESLEELPPEPKRESFATMAKFIQAQAQWRILSKRYDLSRAAQPVVPAIVPVVDKGEKK